MEAIELLSLIKSLTQPIKIEMVNGGNNSIFWTAAISGGAVVIAALISWLGVWGTIKSQERLAIKKIYSEIIHTRRFEALQEIILITTNYNRLANNYAIEKQKLSIALANNNNTQEIEDDISRCWQELGASGYNGLTKIKALTVYFEDTEGFERIEAISINILELLNGSDNYEESRNMALAMGSELNKAVSEIMNKQREIIIKELRG